MSDDRPPGDAIRWVGDAFPSEIQPGDHLNDREWNPMRQDYVVSPLANFLLMRIAADAAELVAHRWDSRRDGVGDPYWACVADHRCGIVVDGADLTPELVANARPAAYRRAEAECEAKRLIVEWHAPDEGMIAADDDGSDVWMEWTCGECRVQGRPCRTLRALALPYADHPDYREEWRP